MKVLLVNGGPHKDGCTHTALQVVAQGLADGGVDADEFWIGNRPIAGCIACHKCRETGTCIFKDVVQDFQAVAPNYDGFVFGSPVHFSGVTGNMKSFMDRAFYSYRRSDNDTFRLKPAAAIVSARRAGTTATVEQLDKYFEIQEMPLVTSVYWNEVHGYTPEDVMADEEGVMVMRTLGRNMAWLLKCMDAGEKHGVQKPERLPRRYTNFIR